MQLKKSKSSKTPLSAKASREHAQRRKNSVHFTILYVLIGLLLTAGLVGGVFLHALWNDRQHNNRYIVGTMISDAISGLYTPVQQIGILNQIVPSMSLILPTDTPGLMQSISGDSTGVLLTTQTALSSVRGIILHSNEPFDGVPKAQKCSVGYIIKDAAKDYYWRGDVAFSEIARVETGDGRTIIIEKNTDELCGDIYSGESYERLDEDLQNLYSY